MNFDQQINLGSGSKTAVPNCNAPEKPSYIRFRDLKVVLKPNALNLIQIPFSTFPAANLNLYNLYELSFERFTPFGKNIIFGPISFFCQLQGPLSTDNRCGSFNKRVCPGDACCNVNGVCGSTPFDCSLSIGCQLGYGKWYF